MTKADSVNFHSNWNEEEEGNWDSDDNRSWEATAPLWTYCRCVYNPVDVKCDKEKHRDRGLDVAEYLQLFCNKLQVTLLVVEPEVAAKAESRNGGEQQPYATRNHPFSKFPYCAVPRPTDSIKS